MPAAIAFAMCLILAVVFGYSRARDERSWSSLLLLLAVAILGWAQFGALIKF